MTPSEQSDIRQMAQQLELAEATIRELWGSYRSLIAATGREDAMNWDGAHMVLSYGDQYGPLGGRRP